MDILTQEEKELAAVASIEALILIESGDCEKAVKKTTELIDKGLIDYCLYNTRGMAYLNSNNPYRASMDFQTAINLADICCFHSNLAIAYKDMGQIEKSIKEFKEAVRLGHRDKEMFKDVIELCEKNARYEDSIYFADVQEGLIDP
jgi:tetratricopeptide (TPR) repeat protein